MTASRTTKARRVIRWHSRAAVRRTAIHEAGHAIVGEVLGSGCAGISIVPDLKEGVGGFALFETGYDLGGIWDARGRWRDMPVILRATAIRFLAGAAAERELLGRADAGDAADRREVRHLINDLGRSGPDAERLAGRLERFTAWLVRRHRDAITGLADALLTHRVMAGEVLADTMERLLPVSPAVARYGAWARSKDAAAMAAEHGLARLLEAA